MTVAVGAPADFTQARGKISVPADLPGRVRDSGFRELSIDFTHAIAAGRLPLIHRGRTSSG